MSESQIPSKPSCTDKNKKDNQTQDQTDNGGPSAADSKLSVASKSEFPIQVNSF